MDKLIKKWNEILKNEQNSNYVELTESGLKKELIIIPSLHKLIFDDCEGFRESDLPKVKSFLTRYGLSDDEWVIVSPTPYLDIPNHIFVDTYFYATKRFFSGSGDKYLPRSVLGADGINEETQDISQNLKYFPYTDTQIEELKTFKKDFIFMSYNRRPTLLRIAFVNRLFETNLIKKGLVSFLAPKEMVLRFMHKSETKKDLINQGTFDRLSDNFLNSIPLIVDMNYDSTPKEIEQKSYDIYHFDKIYYHQSNFTIPFNNIKKCFFNVITETDFYPVPLKLSEKIYKGIGMSPIIVFSTPYSLKRLREHGFKTFPMLFDESYDNIKEDNKRFNKVFSEIERVCNLPLEVLKEKYDEALDVVKYNQQVFLDAPSFIEIVKRRVKNES